jgi:2-phospho-L-lactate transferase/gluconeogenesis factor (CofD/UPF0052 family)
VTAAGAWPARTRVTLFCGGRGSAAIARALVRIPGVELSLLVNGYDNGHSTGALRRYLPGMLGPSDFRKNLLLAPGTAGLLERRLPAGAGGRDVERLAEDLVGRPHDPVRAAVRAELLSFLEHTAGRRDRFDFGDCAVGNLVIAGAHLRLGGRFNAAVEACAAAFGCPARLVNVTNGENAFLVALTADGRLLHDEAEIVAPRRPAPITGLFLVDAEPGPAERAGLAQLTADDIGRAMSGRRAPVTLNPVAERAVRECDLLVYGPGTPHSSLLPSYLTPGMADAVAASGAAAKVQVVNLREDADSVGWGPPELVDATLRYLGDPANERGTVTHVLCAGPPPGPARPPGARWVGADVADRERADVHDGPRTAAALGGILAGAVPGALLGAAGR